MNNLTIKILALALLTAMHSGIALVGVCRIARSGTFHRDQPSLTDGCLAHSDNIASNTSLYHLGYRLVKEFTRCGFRRNLHLLDLSKDY